jgi:hypothetical protein
METRAIRINTGRQTDAIVARAQKKLESIAQWVQGQWVWKQRVAIAASSWLAVPICAALMAVATYCFYVVQNYSAGGEAFAWFDGTSVWPSVAILLFAALLSIHFTIKTHFGLRQNADALTKEFGLQGKIPDKIPFFGWESPPLESGSAFVSPRSPGSETNPQKRINITAVWQGYLRRGRLWRRVLRAAPMTVLYMCALATVLPFFGHFARPPIRGDFDFPSLIGPTISLFLLLTFVVLDAILLHEGFLTQLVERETCWPDATFERFEYPIIPDRPSNERDLADYWDILLIAKRTEAVGNVIYYPFVILSLLIVARLDCFDNWTWPLPVIIALLFHSLLAVYAAWRLPKIATQYRDDVLERLKRRRRQALMVAEKIPETIDTMIEEVQSTHRGAFSYLWEQPALRALLFPSGGIGLATLLQYLPH